MLRTDTGRAAAGGGVCGRLKLKTPRSKLAAAVVYRGNDVVSGICPWVNRLNTNPMKSPAAIQPIVPNTRMNGNCFSWSWMLWNAREFASPSVGM